MKPDMKNILRIFCLILISAQFTSCLKQNSTTLRLHYHRYDAEYGSWGLHLWGDAAATPTSWEIPQGFEGQDDFGAYADIQIEPKGSNLCFIIHKSEQTDFSEARCLNADQREIWIREADAVIHAERPSTNNIPRFAWYIDNKTIKVALAGTDEVHPENVSLRSHDGEGSNITSLEKTEKNLFVRVSKPLNFKKNYILKINDSEVYVFFSREILDQDFYYSGPLGPSLLKNGLVLNVWSPPAIGIDAVFYSRANPTSPLMRVPFSRGAKGLWSLHLKKKDIPFALTDLLYELEVNAHGQTKTTLDPYAKSLVAFNPIEGLTAKAALVDVSQTNPPGFERSYRSNRQLLDGEAMGYIGYEIHVRDFSIDPALDIPDELRGTFMGLREVIPSFKDLGITHVQLLPVQSFHTINERDRSFQGPTIEGNKINYNWGYDPQNYFSLTGWYSTNPDDPSLRISEFKSLVQSFQDNGIGVIMDVVYNHLHRAYILEDVAPGCYMRRDETGTISMKSGAGPSVESRSAMVRRLIIDSLTWFRDEFHINGFRFDLMGFMDVETIKQIRKTLGKDTILYGEAWEFTDLPVKEAVTKSNLPTGIALGAFNDTGRDAITGPMSIKGFVQGAFWEGPQVRASIIAGLKDYTEDYDNDGSPDALLSDDAYHRFAGAPINTLNYLTIHDGFTLWDKINLSTEGSPEEKIKLAKLAAAMLFTSQGRLILHGGCEAGRSKPLAPNDPNPQRAHTTPYVTPENGVTFFHENSYKSPDTTNMIDWARSESFTELRDYFKGLIALRKSASAFHYQKSQSVQAGLRFIGEKPPKESPRTPRFRRFEDMDRLAIQFIHGPANSQLYLAGEVHPKGRDKNPVENPFILDFDGTGHARIVFNKEEIASFDFGAWSDPHNLQVKVVNVAGQWEFPEGAYSPVGNNRVRPTSVLDSGNVIIDLAITDHSPGEESNHHNPYIAFTLDNSLEKSHSAYETFVVIHNADIKPLEIEVPGLSTFRERHILADGDAAGISPLRDSLVKIEGRHVLVPAKTATVIGCRR
jgi:pullulanase